ncbi:multi-sensor signal transduction histidine kinase [Leptolyngbya boryana NIES-2135]|jgi:two-component system sensor histidine kinase NblS|uniref:histidine kinase n=2 Tax=Leptolyngbya boryana TaxID=1184 RepID=A0A1Z4JKV9_LEPBY|nr:MULTISPECIES: HAMP domain-containing histidine kinase [unclassified Leptolyngbya]MBN8563648.1 HAMP domain-containing histidine kinase [Leptolyngbya sp. UWPOB_LEPTO1]BAY57350.1 multi-sensor signal transduction histidine kinase [Leptolyngbya boryana NIES-2135]MBD1854030.1 HAMP domain-containing histidine kinase [Leptolyngbya sp. FACHB-1624]MBD2366899.1 HAMP domain-containing histidine kinase [Leptolyngbya sp. FACHB-161]MBD2378007.1 HAMP domain-containing histidine kinase [Leptolyngbya sp. FAC
MAAATLVVSIVMSGLTFWAVNTIQLDARMNDTRFGSDLGLLLAANVAPLVNEENRTELAQFSHRFYGSTSSIRYMLYADADGNIFFGIPFSDSEVQNSLTIQRKIQLPEDFNERTNRPMVRQHITPDGEVTDVFVPLVFENKYLGVLAIGTNPNPTVVTSSHLTRDVTIAVFVSIWVMVILGAVFNALQITKPIRELVIGVRNIAKGNFKQRVELPVGAGVELSELIASFNDMAERLERYEEQNIEELTAEKAKLETLISTIADGAVLLDANMRIVLANPTARRIFGWENKAIESENAMYFFPVAVQVELTRPLFQMARGELREEAEFRITAIEPNNRTLRILLNAVVDPVRDNVKGIAVTVQDITREVELNEAKSQFISNVSHELRTPLFNIKSFIETLYEYGDELSETQKLEFLETANRETDRLTRLVNDVLDLSRLESCKIYQFEAIDLVQPIEQILRTYQLNAKDKGIELIKDIEPDLPPVFGHYDLLLQVFANLVGNALKFTEAGGKVALRAYSLRSSEDQVQQFVRVEIGDTGIGIDGADQEAIFDRFFRVENRVHTLEGTGLGLSIVKNIIERHRSHVRLVSEVGCGTTFWFDLVVFQENPEFEEMSVTLDSPALLQSKPG